MRVLASIQKIRDIQPIEDADFIELVYILGWQCVAKKGEFNIGDYCVYFEIDSFLPIKPVFEFLRSSSYKNSDILGEGYRLKTQKFRGELSQGLALPLYMFEELNNIEITEGLAVTKLLGVRKYEEGGKVTNGGTIIGRLPYSIPHTDETRIQNVPDIISEFEGKYYYITTKIDGSSYSVSYDIDGFHVTGHNYEYKDDGKCSFYEYVKGLNLKEKLKKYVEDNCLSYMTIQGEYAGPKIQKNRLALMKPEWFVFDIRIDGSRVSLTMLQDIVEEFGLMMVPIEEEGFDLPSQYPNAKALLYRAEGKYVSGLQKEGIVIRTQYPILSNTLGTYLSIKVINNDYLLKYSV